jgi:hypothetical protein
VAPGFYLFFKNVPQNNTEQLLMYFFRLMQNKVGIIRLVAYVSYWSAETGTFIQAPVPAFQWLAKIVNFTLTGEKNV